MQTTTDDSDTPSVQSVERAFALLGIVARGSPQGARLNEIVEHSGLTKTTVHRLLKQLISSDMLLQSPQRLYQLGPGSFELGIAASRNFPLRDLVSPFLEELAQETGDTVFLTVRTGNDALCVDRKTGPYPVKVFSIDVGHRQPLGVGAGGLAMLCALPMDEQRTILEAVGLKLEQPPRGPIDKRELKRVVELARKRGYAQSSDQMLRGVAGVGVALLNPRGRPFAAISVGSFSERMTDERIPEVVATIRHIAARCEQKFAGRGDL